MKKRGRPRICPPCPLCGASALLVRGTKKQGHVLNRWVVCDACGAKLRFVQTGARDWFRVRNPLESNGVRP